MHRPAQRRSRSSPTLGQKQSTATSRVTSRLLLSWTASSPTTSPLTRSPWLGFASMAGMAGLEEAITGELRVPVIDGVGAAVRLAEAVVGLGLKTSKRSTYAVPEPKKIIGWPLSTSLGLRADGAAVRSRK